MVKKKNKLSAPSLPIDFDRTAAEKLLADLGQLDRDIQRLSANVDDEIAVLQAGLAAAQQPLVAEFEKKRDLLIRWADANRSEICPAGSKTAKLATGEISWRLNPTSVAIKKVEAVLESLKALKLKRFIRVKEEIDKDAILKEPGRVQHVAGITLVQDEVVTLKPNQGAEAPIEFKRRAS